MVRKIFTKAFLQETSNKPWFYPLALLFVGLVAYGLMIPGLGFYWDDWESVFLYNLHTPAISFNYYAERPFSALAYLVFFLLIKMTPVAWQFLALFLRWGAILLLYLTLNAVWPERTTQNRWIGILLFVFPGYLLQPVSTAFNPHLTVFLMFSGSLFMTVLALKDRKRFWLWMPLSVLVGITQIFMMEYFVGLEIIRPVLIFFTLQTRQAEKKRRLLLRTLLYWLPFLVGLGIYAWWRFIYLSQTLPADPNAPVLLKEILKSPLEGLSALFTTVYQDIGYLLAAAWTRAFSTDVINLFSKTTWFVWFFGIVVAVSISLYLTIASLSDGQVEDKTTVKVFFLGCLAILGGAAPVWAKGSQISVGKWSDRFALAAMVGAVILIVISVDWLIKTQNQKRVILAILLASSVALQIDNGNKFRLDWELQRELYWQLAWRIPALKPGTAVIGNGTFTDKSSYYDGVYIINLLFDKTPSANPRYTYLDIGHYPSSNYHPGVPILTEQRGGQFSGNTSQAIGIFLKSSGACVRVLDNIYTGDPFFSNAMNQLIAISNTDQILTAAPPLSPNPAIFGNEIQHDWCYYFEKADLARQMQDWQTVLRLGQEAKAMGFTPGMGAEYLPFIEAYAQTGQWSMAFDLSVSAAKVSSDHDLRPALCNDWSQFSGITAGPERDTYLAKAKSEFCASGLN
jgi:hypothetical protein